MAATRLRRTFQYPSESDDEDAVEQGMDEQDQSNLISTLSARDTSSTHTYTILLAVLPLASALFHIPLLASLSSVLPALLAITSFLASAYALYFLPLPPVKVGVISLDEVKNGRGKRTGGYGLNTNPTSASSGSSGNSSDATTHERRPVPYISDEVADLLAKYIVPANGVVCLIFALLALWQGRSWSEGVGVGGGYLPGFVLCVIMWARRQLRIVDLAELEKLKYGAKGM